jgi:hypothetical protein
MISYCRIANDVWRSVAASDIGEVGIKKETISYLDYIVQNWQSTIPESLQYRPTDNSPNTSLSRGERRLRLVLYLRANQMRIQIYRHILHSATSIMESLENARIAVDIAKDSITVLTRVNQTSDLYRSQQICFNHFLVSALAVLFLAVSHAPVEFNRQVRDEFYMALDLVKGFSKKSHIAKRLWRTIRNLKEVAPRLGLVSRRVLEGASDPHSTAAVAMAGLAGHNVDELLAFPNGTGYKAESSPVDGQQISCELTNLFEAAGGPGMMPNVVVGEGGVNGFAPGAPTPESMTSIYGNEEEFARIMRDCF